MITVEGIQDYWNRYDWFIIRWNIISFFGFPFIWLAYILKYKFGIKGLWLLNDTVDGDFGSKKELEDAGREPGETWSNFWWWWFRNHSWNFNRKFIPQWNGGKAESFKVISTSLTREQIEEDRWTWCSKNGIHGHHYIAAIINGKIECRFSEANDKMQRQMGSGGNEYRFRFKGLPIIFVNRIRMIKI